MDLLIKVACFVKNCKIFNIKKVVSTGRSTVLSLPLNKTSLVKSAAKIIGGLNASRLPPPLTQRNAFHGQTLEYSAHS
jgi:hypothetical protein